MPTDFTKQVSESGCQTWCLLNKPQVSDNHWANRAPRTPQTPDNWEPAAWQQSLRCGASGTVRKQLVPVFFVGVCGPIGSHKCCVSPSVTKESHETLCLIRGLLAPLFVSQTPTDTRSLRCGGSGTVRKQLVPVFFVGVCGPIGSHNCCMSPSVTKESHETLCLSDWLFLGVSWLRCLCHRPPQTPDSWEPVAWQQALGCGASGTVRKQLVPVFFVGVCGPIGSHKCCVSPSVTKESHETLSQRLAAFRVSGLRVCMGLQGL